MPKHQHTAVERNRLKRRLRELMRVELLPRLRTGPALDLAIRAQAHAYGASFGELQGDVVALLGRIPSGNSDRS